MVSWGGVAMVTPRNEAIPTFRDKIFSSAEWVTSVSLFIRKKADALIAIHLDPSEFLERKQCGDSLAVQLQTTQVAKEAEINSMGFSK